MRLFLIVRNEQKGHAHAPLQILQLRANLFAKLRIERGERLVEQQHLRLQRQRPRQGHALPLASGKLRRHARGFIA